MRGDAPLFLPDRVIVTARTVWYVVCDITQPAAEPFIVMRVDTSIRRDGGVEGTVVSLHWRREDAERIVHELNDGLFN